MTRTHVNPSVHSVSDISLDSLFKHEIVILKNNPSQFTKIKRPFPVIPLETPGYSISDISMSKDHHTTLGLCQPLMDSEQNLQRGKLTLNCEGKQIARGKKER